MTTRIRIGQDPADTQVIYSAGGPLLLAEGTLEIELSAQLLPVLRQLLLSANEAYGEPDTPLLPTVPPKPSTEGM